MLNLTRRHILRAAPVVAVSVPSIAIAAEPEMTAKERYDFHLSELMKAAENIDPSIKQWHTVFLGNANDDAACRIVITAFNWADRNEKEVKVHFDDGSPLLADDVTGSTAFADWERQNG